LRVDATGAAGCGKQTDGLCAVVRKNCLFSYGYSANIINWSIFCLLCRKVSHHWDDR